MLLYLVQHAEAKSEEEDPERSLTEKGLQDIKKVASYLARLNIKVDEIFHSGKKRALQTAEVLAKNLKPKKGVSTKDGLAPLDDPQIWLERLSELEEEVMIVGHLPHLSKLASLLLTGDKEKPIVTFKNAGLLCLKRSGNNWSVEWMITPDLIYCSSTSY
jgi:phosphohistidine phosphatase